MRGAEPDEPDEPREPEEVRVRTVPGDPVDPLPDVLCDPLVRVLAAGAALLEVGAAECEPLVRVEATGAPEAVLPGGVRP